MLFGGRRRNSLIRNRIKQPAGWLHKGSDLDKEQGQEQHEQSRGNSILSMINSFWNGNPGVMMSLQQSTKGISVPQCRTEWTRFLKGTEIFLFVGTRAAIFFSVPLFGHGIFLIISIFHFENLSKFIIFSNEDVRRIEPQTNNHKSNYQTTRPARDELPDLRF